MTLGFFDLFNHMALFEVTLSAAPLRGVIHNDWQVSIFTFIWWCFSYWPKFTVAAIWVARCIFSRAAVFFDDLLLKPLSYLPNIIFLINTGLKASNIQQVGLCVRPFITFKLISELCWGHAEVFINRLSCRIFSFIWVWTRFEYLHFVASAIATFVAWAGVLVLFFLRQQLICSEHWLRVCSLTLHWVILEIIADV